MEFGPRRHCYPDAFFDVGGSQQRLPGPGENRDFNRTPQRIDRERITSVETNGTNVAAAKTVLTNDFAGGRGKFLLGVGNPNPVNGRGVLQTSQVRVQAKHGWARLRSVTANSFEHSAAIVQSVRGDMNRGRSPGDDLAVLPNPLRS